MLEPLYQFYAATSLSAAVRDSRWIFATFEVVHLFGLALAGGAILVLAAHLAGRRIGAGDARKVWTGLRRLIAMGLAISVASGIVLVGVNPLKYYFNPSFNVKLWLLAATILVALGTDRLSVQSDRPALLWRAAGLVLAALFLSVGLAGRAIGLL